ncbi:MAG: hypothetical protein ACMG6E_00115 [Candidatus Roizmanbacteria bacterium]
MDNKLVVLVLVFFLAIGAFSLTLFTSNSARQIRAVNRTAVRQNSLCFASPLSVKAGQNTTITCVARDEKTNAVPGTQCCLSSTGGSLAQNCGQTDSNGIFQSILTTSTDASVSCVINGSISLGPVSIGITPQ